MIKINKFLIITLLIISITTLWLNIKNEKKQTHSEKEYSQRSLYEILSIKNN